MKLRGALAAAAMVGVLAGCGGSSGSAPSSSENDVPKASDLATLSSQATAARAPANPVTVLRRVTGCTFDPGVTTGEYDIVGALFASCNVESLNARVEARCVTDETHDAEQNLGTTGQPSTDETKKILDNKDNCFVAVSAPDGSIVPTSTAESVAFELGGTYLPPAS